MALGGMVVAVEGTSVDDGVSVEGTWVGGRVFVAGGLVAVAGTVVAVGIGGVEVGAVVGLARLTVGTGVELAAGTAVGGTGVAVALVTLATVIGVALARGWTTGSGPLPGVLVERGVGCSFATRTAMAVVAVGLGVGRVALLPGVPA